MFWISPIMTIMGGITSFNPWGWIGGEGLFSLFMFFFFPGFFYCLGVIILPFIVAMFNMYIQPFYYLAFLFEPIFKNFKDVKEVMLAHSHIIGIVGIIITVLSAIQNSVNAPGFIIGVVIMSIITIIMGPAKKHIQNSIDKMQNN